MRDNKSERVVVVVEARMGSSRLPGKSLRPLAGVPLVGRVIERARLARCADEVVVATTARDLDDPLAEYARSLGAPVFRGSEDDVLARILGASEAHGAAIHVQCWGDCPLLDAGEIDRAVALLREGSYDLTGNALDAGRQLPYGLDVIALRTDALRIAEQETRENAYHREHGTTFLYQHPERFRIAHLPTPEALRCPGFNATINVEDDYRFIERLYELLAPTKPAFSAQEAMEFIRATPELLAHPNARALTPGTTS